MDRLVSTSIGLVFLLALLLPATLVVSPTSPQLLAEVRAGETSPPARAAESLYALDLMIETSDGSLSSLRTLAGKPRIATMFYAHCQSMCPLTIQTLKELDRSLSPAERQALGYVVLSLDPQRDAPEVLRERSRAQGLDAGRWFLARTRAVDVSAAADFLGIRWRSLSNGEIDHAGALVLLDAQGRELSRTSTVGAVDAQFLSDVREAVHGSMAP
jgi:protein SCO1/2